MRNQKKKFSRNFQDEEAEKKLFSTFEKAAKGDVEAMMRALMGSGRGYEMSESDLMKILQNHKRARC